MHAFKNFSSIGAAPLTLAAAGLVASSAIFERRTRATSVAIAQQASQQQKGGGQQEQPSGAGGGESGRQQPLHPPPIGPMVAVFLDNTSVDKLKSHFPEARDGQLRKVILQYGPSASEREMYRHLFSGKAEVTITGDASSFARRALVASVSHAGKLVEPVSLSAAIDISPPVIADPDAPAVDEKDGPGPLASAVLIEQVKTAGATKELGGHTPTAVGPRPTISSEPGAYVRLKEPITVQGTICRADWVDGASSTCLDTLEGGKKRDEDWVASDCPMCAFFSASPCNRIFDRFVATSKRHDEHLKTFEPEEQADGDGEEFSHGEAGGVQETREGTREAADATATAATVGRTGTPDGRLANTGLAAGEATGKEGLPAGKEGVNGAAGNAAEERLRRQAERDLIEKELEREIRGIFSEMQECMVFHDML